MMTIRAASNIGWLCAAMLLTGCGAGSATNAGSTANTIAGSIVPSASYELDAIDIQGNYAYILGDNGNQGSASSAAQFYVVDITHPAAMALVSTKPITGSIFYGQSGIRVQGNYVYLSRPQERRTQICCKSTMCRTHPLRRSQAACRCRCLRLVFGCLENMRMSFRMSAMLLQAAWPSSTFPIRHRPPLSARPPPEPPVCMLRTSRWLETTPMSPGRAAVFPQNLSSTSPILRPPLCLVACWRRIVRKGSTLPAATGTRPSMMATRSTFTTSRTRPRFRWQAAPHSPQPASRRTLPFRELRRMWRVTRIHR